MISINTEIQRHARRGDVDIDVTGVDLVVLLQAAYAFSRPQGAGVLRYRPGPLTDEQSQGIVDLDRPPGIALRADYVFGRAVKLQVRRDGDRLLMRSTWLDHSDFELCEVLYRCGLDLWHR